MQLEVGQIVEGKVTGITNFGAFVQLEGKTTGLVHISEVALSYVKDIREHLKEQETVRVKVLSIDANGKISLSIKKVLEEEQKRAGRIPAQISFDRNNADLSFEDKMKQFMQDSDERMAAIRRNIDGKRGSRK